MRFDYFYGSQPEQYAFIRTPKVFFTDSRFKKLSAEAKLLYGLLLDRLSLSIKNNWMDEQRRNYIYMTIDSIEEDLGCARQKACKMLDDLETFGLIERVRKGFGRPNVIYVKNFYALDSEGQKIIPEKYENQTSSSMKTISHEVLKSNSNNTDINNTDTNNTNLSIYGIENDTMDGYYRYFENRLSIRRLIEDNPYEKDLILEMLDIIVETMSSNKAYIRIEGQNKPVDVVKSQLMKLDETHIEYVIECIGELSVPVKNIKQYILTSLYNAPLTISAYYQVKVKGDMFKYNKGDSL